ncbi:MAG: tetratricopeptide repeat protein [Treponema sp.]|nr:tetratricopeptide repeat protein [Treponema sp.]
MSRRLIWRAAVAAAFALSASVVFPQARPDALVEFRMGNYERAVEITLGELAVNDRNMDSYVVLCWALISLGRFDEAMRFANMARAINRHDPRIIEILGEVYFFMGNNNEALRYFQQYINIAPEGSRIHLVYYFIGEIFIRTGRFRHADIALTTAVHKRPGNAEWWARLAFARENAGELAQAVVAYERALALNSRLTDAQRGLERVRVALGGRR